MLNTIKLTNNISPNENILQQPEPPQETVNNIQKEIKKNYTLQTVNGIMNLKIENDNLFQFYDISNVFIGQYSVRDILSYVSNVSIMEQSTKNLIELTVCNKTNDVNVFKLNVTSPVMRDIDLLMILNVQFRLLDESDMNNNKIIKTFIYSFVEHTILIISIISKELKDTNNDALKNKLMRYSIGLVYRLTQYLNVLNNETEIKYRELLMTMTTVKDIESKLETKISKIIS